MRHEESRIQQACIRWFRLQYPKLALVMFSVPNGGARRRIEGAIMKAEGVTRGVADLLLLYPSKHYHGLAIEMKTQKGRQQPSQKIWQRAVEDAGYKYIIVRSIEEFIDAVNGYLREVI